jgi:phosphoadenosine phosphosulfate reductase
VKTALQFSGGKDSLALLWYMEALWPYLDVVYMDSGDAFPSTQGMVTYLKSIVPNFIHLRGDSVEYRRQYGDPTPRSWVNCCKDNIWQPIYEYVRDRGYRQILRGSKACDPHVHMTFPGDVLEGVLFTYPLWHWSDADVKSYLGDRLPPAYLMGAVGMPDCRTCTAVEACGGSTRQVWKALHADV